MSWRTKSVKSLRISFENQKTDQSNKKQYARKVAGFASTIRTRGVIKNTSIELSNDLKNELKDIRSRINECIKKEKLEVNGVHRDEMASTLRRSLSQYPIEVIDQMIDRKGKKPQDMKSLSTKTLEGFYKNTRVFQQNKPKVNMNTSTTESYYFHKFTQLLPVKLKCIDDKCISKNEKEEKKYSPAPKRRSIVENIDSTPDFVNNLLTYMKTTYPERQNENSSIEQIKLPKTIKENHSKAQIITSRNFFKRRIVKAQQSAVDQGAKANECTTTNSDETLTPRLTGRRSDGFCTWVKIQNSQADTSEKHKEIQNKAQFKKEASSSLNFDEKEANFKSSEIPQFVTLKGKDFRFAKAKKASLEPLDQEYEREQNKNVIHTFRNENNPFRSVKINKHNEIVQMDINDENLDKILGSSNSYRRSNPKLDEYK